MILDTVSEAYINKPRRCLEMEKCIERLRKKYTGNNDLDTALASNALQTIASDADWLKWQKLLEDEFGFYSVSLNLDFAMATPNAYTIPVHIAIDSWPKLRKSLTVNKNFIKYDKKDEVCTYIAITPELLFSSILTPSEVLSIILHEVGHNFEYPILVTMQPINVMYVLSTMFNSLSSGNIALYPMIFTSICTPGQKLKNDIKKYIQRNKNIQIAVDLFDVIRTLPIRILSVFLMAIAPILNAFGLGKIVSYLITLAKPDTFVQNLIFGSLSFKSEKVADQFVAIVGYGPEMATALNKLNYTTDYVGVSEALAKIPLIGHMMGLNQFIFEHIASVFDGHPDINTRCLSLVKILEKDLDDPRVDAKTKELVKRDIKLIYDAVGEFKQGNVNLRTNDDKTNYEMETKGLLNDMTNFFLGSYGDIRSVILDKVIGGSSEIHDSLEKKKRGESWF